MRSYDHVENPAAYERAIQERIKMNARKTRVRKFAEAEPELKAQLDELWYPRWKSCCDSPALNEWGRCESCGGEGGTMDWQQDGSHLDLQIFTVKQLRSIARKISWLRDGYEEYGSLTEKQAAKAKQIIAETVANVKRYEEEDELRKLNAEPWPESTDRVEYDVRVVSAKIKESPSFNPYDRHMDLKWVMTVEREDGSRAWGTVPSKLLDAIDAAMQEAEESGCVWSDEKTAARYLRNAPTIRLRASWVRKDDDPIFAFFKRPHFVGFMHDITGEALDALASTEEE